MERKTLAALGVAAIVAAAVACDRTSSAPTSPTTSAPATANAAADGSTLKVSAPTPQSPINDQTFQNPPITLSASTSNAKYGSITPQYRFQVISPAGTTVQDSGLLNATSFQINQDLLTGKTRYTWRVRAEYQGAVGPWSSTGSFIAPDPALIADALTSGTTIGTKMGGHFILGQGWQADTVTDAIAYDVPTCTSCKLEFDIANCGKGSDADGADLKWISMGDAPAFNDFTVFRDHPWKMHLERRADGNGTGMKLIWRNGAAGGGEPGDHTGKVDPGPDWRDTNVYHFVLSWTPNGFSVAIGTNGGTPETWFADGFGGNAYAPPRFHIELGTRPRSETLVGAIWRNVKLTKQ